MLNGSANLREFHRRKRVKFYSKDPLFLCRKTLRNGMEFRQDWYLSLRTLSNRAMNIYLACSFRNCEFL